MDIIIWNTKKEIIHEYEKYTLNHEYKKYLLI